MYSGVVTSGETHKIPAAATRSQDTGTDQLRDQVSKVAQERIDPNLFSGDRGLPVPELLPVQPPFSGLFPPQPPFSGLFPPQPLFSGLHPVQSPFPGFLPGQSPLPGFLPGQPLLLGLTPPQLRFPGFLPGQPPFLGWHPLQSPFSALHPPQRPFLALHPLQSPFSGLPPPQLPFRGLLPAELPRQGLSSGHPLAGTEDFENYEDETSESDEDERSEADSPTKALLSLQRSDLPPTGESHPQTTDLNGHLEDELLDRKDTGTSKLNSRRHKIFRPSDLKCILCNPVVTFTGSRLFFKHCKSEHPSVKIPCWQPNCVSKPKAPEDLVNHFIRKHALPDRYTCGGINGVPCEFLYKAGHIGSMRSHYTKHHLNISGNMENNRRNQLDRMVDQVQEHPEKPKCFIYRRVLLSADQQ